MKVCETEMLLSEYLNFSQYRKTFQILGEIRDLYGNHLFPTLKGRVYTVDLQSPNCGQRHVLPVFNMPT